MATLATANPRKIPSHLGSTKPAENRECKPPTRGARRTLSDNQSGTVGSVPYGLHGDLTIISNAVAADLDIVASGDALASANVTISAGFRPGDQLTINGATSGTLDGEKIAFAFNGGARGSPPSLSEH